MDAVATEPFAALPVKEFATISAKAAITSKEYEPCKYGKEHSALMPDILFDNFTKRFTLMANRYEDGTEVLNSAKEDTTDYDP